MRVCSYVRNGAQVHSCTSPSHGATLCTLSSHRDQPRPAETRRPRGRLQFQPFSTASPQANRPIQKKAWGAVGKAHGPGASGLSCPQWAPRHGSHPASEGRGEDRAEQGGLAAASELPADRATAAGSWGQVTPAAGSHPPQRDMLGTASGLLESGVVTSCWGRSSSSQTPTECWD